MKRRIVTTSLLFLGIIFVGLLMRMFVGGSELFVTTEPEFQAAKSPEALLSD
jgi:hypothetical protein